MSTATTKTTNKSAAAKSTTAPSEGSAASTKSPLPQAPTTKKSMASPSANKSDDKVIAARKKNLDLAISQIQKDFGEFGLEIHFSGKAEIFYEELFDQMKVHVASIISNSLDIFMH